VRAAAVTGLAAEARLARRAGLEAVAAGGDPARTQAVAERLLAAGAAGLVSFGIAGGLAPDLPGGTLLLPDAVRDEAGGRWAVDPGWRAIVAAALSEGAFVGGGILGADAVVGEVGRKRALFRSSGAVAVDLESHVVARAAARAGRPFLVLRAVADPGSRGLPPAAVVGLDAAGRPALGRVLGSLLRQPRQIPSLLLVARDTRRALASLRRAAAACRGALPPA
jgi:hopanoid-associated phosphorylase